MMESLKVESINKTCDELLAKYHKKYKDRNARKVIKQTIDLLRNEGLKKKDSAYVNKTAKEYETKMIIPSYTTQTGITYLGRSYVTLSGCFITNTFISDCSGANSYTFTFNVTETFLGEYSVKTTMLRFSVSLPDFDKRAISNKLGFNITFAEIGIKHVINSFVSMYVSVGIGIGIEAGYNFDLSDLKIEVYYKVGVALIRMIKIIFSIKNMLEGYII